MQFFFSFFFKKNFFGGLDLFYRGIGKNKWFAFTTKGTCRIPDSAGSGRGRGRNQPPAGCAVTSRVDVLNDRLGRDGRGEEIVDEDKISYCK